MDVRGGFSDCPGIDELIVNAETGSWSVAAQAGRRTGAGASAASALAGSAGAAGPPRTAFDGTVFKGENLRSMGSDALRVPVNVKRLR